MGRDFLNLTMTILHECSNWAEVGPFMNDSYSHDSINSDHSVFLTLKLENLRTKKKTGLGEEAFPVVVIYW
jgi:hypothetical protein